MENNQISTQSENFNLTPLAEIQVAKQGKQILNCSEEDIKQVLRYALTLLGVPASKIPNDEAKHAMLVFIKRKLWLNKIDELRLAFEYAVEKRTEVKLTLFDEPFSVKIIMEVWDAYETYRKNLIAKQPKTDENSMNVYTQGNAIVKMLDTETREKIVELAEKDKIKIDKPSREKSKYHDMHQRWMKHWDKLRENYEVPKSNGRMIWRYGRAINIDEFFTKKFEQLQLYAERNKDKL